MLFEMKEARPALMRESAEIRRKVADAARKDPAAQAGLRKGCAVAAADLVSRLDSGPSLASVAGELAVSMLSVAGVVADLGADPDERDLTVAAMTAIVEDFNALDRAILLNDWASVAVAAVRVELTLRGLATALGLPYGALVQSAAACVGDRAKLDAEVQALLGTSGLAASPSS